MIAELRKKEILEAAKKWFREVVVPNHIKNTKALSNPKKFKINPFLVKYLANFLCGTCDPISIAKALIYPRVLATSITTSFGTNIQKFVSDLRSSFGSMIPGIDIQFEDQIDGRTKYCQIKLGPNNINKDDVETIHNHFASAKNLARTNNVKSLGYNDLIIGVLYGEHSQLSTHYKNLEKVHHYSVYVGKEFWERLTGDENFYYDLSTAISEIAIEFNSSKLLEAVILKLAESDMVKNLAQ